MTPAQESDVRAATGGHYSGARMQTRLLWRRSATAIGLYGSVGLGLLASVVAARQLGPTRTGCSPLRSPRPGSSRSSST